MYETCQLKRGVGAGYALSQRGVYSRGDRARASFRRQPAKLRD